MVLINSLKNNMYSLQRATGLKGLINHICYDLKLDRFMYSFICSLNIGLPVYYVNGFDKTIQTLSESTVKCQCILIDDDYMYYRYCNVCAN